MALRAHHGHRRTAHQVEHRDQCEEQVVDDEGTVGHSGRVGWTREGAGARHVAFPAAVFCHRPWRQVHVYVERGRRQHRQLCPGRGNGSKSHRRQQVTSGWKSAVGVSQEMIDLAATHASMRTGR